MDQQWRSGSECSVKEAGPFCERTQKQKFWEEFWGLCNAASEDSEAVFLARREEKGSRRENEVSEIFIFSFAWILVLEAVDQH